MARTVTDAAILLGALEGAAPDPNDPATKTCTPPPGRDYTKFLDAGGLKGARIGIPRAFFYDKLTPPGGKEPRGGVNADQAKVMAEAIDVLKQQGASVVDPADIPSVVDKDAKSNFLCWGICSGWSEGKGKDADCSVAFKYGMKRDFNEWLATLGPAAPVKTLTELREWNLTHTKAGAIKYGQSNLDISDEMDVEADRARYEADRAKDIALAGPHGIDEVMKAQKLDALLFPGAGRGRHRGEARLSDGDRPVRDGAERADRARRALPGRFQRQAGALRRQLHGDGLQRAEAPRAGVCLRAGDEAPRAAALDRDALTRGEPASQRVFSPRDRHSPACARSLASSNTRRARSTSKGRSSRVCGSHSLRGTPKKSPP